MVVPEIESEQDYFRLNAEDYITASKKVIPKEGDQVVIKVMALPMDGILTEGRLMGFTPVYYRGIFVADHDGDGEWKTLSGKCPSHTTMKQIRVVNEDKIWEL